MCFFLYSDEKWGNVCVGEAAWLALVNILHSEAVAYHTVIFTVNAMLEGLVGHLISRSLMVARAALVSLQKTGATEI